MEPILAIPKPDYTPDPVYGLGTTAGLPDYNPPEPAGLTFDYAAVEALRARTPQLGRGSEAHTLGS